jgi:hypothetical protein
MILELTILNPTGQIQHLVECLLINWGKYPHDYIGAIDDMLRFYRVLLIIYSCIFWVLWIDVGVKIDPLKHFLGQ